MTLQQAIRFVSAAHQLVTRSGFDQPTDPTLRAQDLPVGKSRALLRARLWALVTVPAAPPQWLPNLAHTRLHVVKRGYTERGLPAACDKQGIFLRDDLPWEHKSLPQCRICTRVHA